MYLGQIRVKTMSDTSTDILELASNKCNFIVNHIKVGKSHCDFCKSPPTYIQLCSCNIHIATKVVKYTILLNNSLLNGRWQKPVFFLEPAADRLLGSTDRLQKGQNRAQIELSKNVYLISVALLVTEIWPFKVWVKNQCKNSTKFFISGYKSPLN